MQNTFIYTIIIKQSELFSHYNTFLSSMKKTKPL